MNSPVLAGRSFQQILWGVFLFFYLPATYFFGWGLLSTAGIDFPSYYYAARLTFVEGRSPYGFGAFFMLPADPGRTVQPYIYPPPSLLAFWPLARLSLAEARAAFFVASHLCLLGAIWLMLTKLMPFSREERVREITLLVGLVYLMCFDPSFANLGLGQVNVAVLFFICLALAALKKDAPDWEIALPLAIAILLKTYPVLLLILLFFRKRIRAAVLTSVFFGAFTALAALVLPGKVWHSWWVEVIPLSGYANNGIAAAYAWNQSLNGFVMRLLLPNSFSPTPLNYPFLAKPMATLLAAVLVGVTLFYSFRASKRSGYKLQEGDEVAAFLLMIYLIAPLSWDHHLVYILPAALLALKLIIEGSTSGKAAVVLGTALVLMAWKFPLDSPAFMHGWWTLLISTKFYAVMVLWIFFINRLRRSSTTLEAPSDAGLESNLASFAG